jgi:hypothetical protein
MITGEAEMLQCVYEDGRRPNLSELVKVYKTSPVYVKRRISVGP